jgi:hypothetical protein
MQVCQDLLNHCEAEGVSCTASSPVTRRVVTTEIETILGVATCKFPIKEKVQDTAISR